MTAKNSERTVLSSRSRCMALLSVPMLLATFLLPTPSATAECCDPKSPFRRGEGLAETAATCKTLAHWAARAPTTDVRISMAITGTLSGVHSDGVLAYLEMCEPKGLRAVCITYSTNGMRVGDTVTFAGGFVSTNGTWVKLDPCLASR